MPVAAAAAQRDYSTSMRALYVHDALTDNGAVRTSLDVAERLIAAGEEAAVFALFEAPPHLTPNVPASVPVVRGFPGRRRARWELPGLLLRLARACRAADVVVCGSEVGRGLVAAGLVARVLRKPYVTVVQADLRRANEQWMPRWMQPLVRDTHRHAAAVICVADEIAQALRQSGFGPDRIRLVPNGVHVERLREAAASASRDGAERARIVGVGRLSPEKGFDLLVRAHAQVRPVVPHELVLIGEGSERESLERLVAELGVRDSVSLTGFRREPFATVASASAFVLSSRREGVPVALLEAIALGTPVIATRCTSAIDDILGHGAYGDIVENGSVAALADAIQRHLEDPSVLRRRVAAAAPHVERYGIDATAAGHLRVLRDVAGRPQRLRTRGDRTPS